MEKDLQDESDIDFEPLASEEEDSEKDEAPYEIRTYGADLTLEIYVSKLKSGEIRVPDFQREYVWNIKKASKLIESFLLDLPVPQVFLYREVDNRNLLVVDGQQRLISVKKYLGGMWEKDKPFALQGVREKWNGKCFADLATEEQRRLLNYILRAQIFEQLNSADNRSIFEIFHRLNTGGMPLNEQEVRDAVIKGNIVAFLRELNKLPSWRKLVGKDPDKRRKDVEMILRFFALFDGWENYSKPMKDFMTSFMQKNSDINDTQREDYTKVFTAVSDKILADVGPDAFRAPTGRLNIAILDSIMVAVASIGPNQVKDLKNRVRELKSLGEYREYVFQATTNVETVTRRIQIASRIIGK